MQGNKIARQYWRRVDLCARGKQQDENVVVGEEEEEEEEEEAGSLPSDACPAEKPW